jgi:hypothetical protein
VTWAISYELIIGEILDWPNSPLSWASRSFEFALGSQLTHPTPLPLWTPCHRLLSAMQGEPLGTLQPWLYWYGHMCQIHLRTVGGSPQCQHGSPLTAFDIFFGSL